MKTVVLAAGKGTRLLPLTQDIPKVLVEVNKKPFLYYVLKTLQKAHCTDIGVVVGYKKEKVAEFIATYGFPVTLIEQAKQEGTGDAVLAARDFVGKENFVVLGGDNLWSVRDIKAMAKDDSLHYVCAAETKEPSKYGVLIQHKGRVEEIREKPTHFCGNLVNTGLYKFTPAIFDALKTIPTSSRGELELTDAVTVLAGQKTVKIIKVSDFWLDLGSMKDIEIISSFLQKHWKES